MNFEESTYSLTEFLVRNRFSVTNRSHHFIEYSSNAAVITVGYASLEYLFYIHVGQNLESLTELTPAAVDEVFKDDSFRFQSTLTIENLISFLQAGGRSIVLGDKKAFAALKDFSGRQSRKHTKQMSQVQNLQWADNAWKQKDYANYIKCIDKTEKSLLPTSYLKKYKIAVDKIQEQTG